MSLWPWLAMTGNDMPTLRDKRILNIQDTQSALGVTVN